MDEDHKNQLLWSPSDQKIKNSNLYRFISHLNCPLDYHQFHQYSVKNKNHFWKELISFFNVSYTGNLEPVLLEDSFKSYTWFGQVDLNFAENLLKAGDDLSIAINFQSESGNEKKINYRELKDEVRRLSHYLKDFLSPGEVLAAYMPNIPETVVAMLSTSAIGGVFTSISSDFGVAAVVDRLMLSKPKVLIAAIGHHYNGKYFDLSDHLKEIINRLPFIEKIIIVDYIKKNCHILQFENAIKYQDILALPCEKELLFLRLSFSHPLYIMYSSGTTGKPKCMVHSQGGTLLAHIKELGLHLDLKAKKKIFYFTTCGWMMWNWLISALYFQAEIILYEGSPSFPSPLYFFNMIDRLKINIFGTSPQFLKGLENSGAIFSSSSSFESLETILSTGSPLLLEQFDFVYEKIKKDVQLSSISGGTDILGCFMLGSPLLPVFRGEIQALGLGLDVHAFNQNGESVLEEEGELVCKNTFPNRPLYFLNDDQNELMNSTYFNKFENVWAHGDFIKISKKGGVMVKGRSDATLNSKGVRIGTAEIYAQTEMINFIQDALCVGRLKNNDEEIILFVKLKPGEELSDDRKKMIKDHIRKNTTARHVPSEIFAVTDIPYTFSGKKVELAVKKILAGKEVTNLDALINPQCLAEYKKQF